MKPLPFLAALMGLTLMASAADTKTPAAPTTPAPAKTEKKAEPKPAEKPAKAMPMNHKADEIDVAAKTFTYTTEKGTKVVHKLTDKTIIMQGDKPAQFSDIKVGDVISGSHIKISDTEYEVVKITKFAAPKEKEKAPEKTAEPKKK